MPRIPHDELSRHTFAQPEHATVRFRLVLPPGIVAAIDWPTLEACDGTFVSGRLRKRHTDLLFRAEPGSESLDALLPYLMRATPLEPERLLEVVWQNIDKEIQMKFKSTAVQLHERGFAEGEARGKAEGLAAILSDLLTSRFGTIPAPSPPASAPPNPPNSAPGPAAASTQPRSTTSSRAAEPPVGTSPTPATFPYEPVAPQPPARLTACPSTGEVAEWPIASPC